MPALDNYTWRQRNPYDWANPLSKDAGTSGAAGGVGGGAPQPQIDGPFMAFGTTFWVRTADCSVGFNVDADPDPDIWQSKQQICDNPDLQNRVKLAISVQLEALNCGPLPCVEGLT